MKRTYYDRVDKVQDTILYYARHNQHEKYAGILDWYYLEKSDKVVSFPHQNWKEYKDPNIDEPFEYVMTTEDGNIYAA